MTPEHLRLEAADKGTVREDLAGRGRTIRLWS